MYIKQIFVLTFLLVWMSGFGEGFTVGQRGFVENKGQIRDQSGKANKGVLYLYTSKGLNLQLKSNGYSYEIFRTQGDVQMASLRKKPGTTGLPAVPRVNYSRIDVEFAGMNPGVRVTAEDVCRERLNYIDAVQELYNIRSYRKITYQEVYPNTDIEFIVSVNEQSPVKYNIILRPGAEMARVKFKVNGAEVSHTEGMLKFVTPLGEISENIPCSYYSDTPSQKRNISFVLDNNAISFEGNYDPTRTFIIDPSSNLVWGTYFGGTAYEYCNSNGTDSQGNIYFLGHTLSTSNIATIGAWQGSIGGNLDIFLTKFDPTGAVIWATYFGGSGNEQGYDLFVHPSGTVYIAGDSSTPSGMATAGAHQTVYGGGLDDAMLAEFDSNGQRVWSTYYGGTEHDFAYSVTRDSNGNLIIGGHTESAGPANSISTPGSFQPNFVFFVDCFIAKFNSAGVRQWGSYYGDSGNEEVLGVAADPNSGDVLITGFTSSFSNMTTLNSHQTFFGGGTLDAFITKIAAGGGTLTWASYYGDSGEEQGYDVEVNSSGDVFFGGQSSSAFNLTTPGCYQPAHGGSEDVFLCRFNTNGVRQWCTYYGGTGSEYLFDLKLDAQSNIFVGGQTTSTNAIASADAYQPAIGQANTYDGYFGKFSPGGNKKILSTYYGKSGEEAIRGIAFGTGTANIIYVCGETTSSSGMTTPGVYQQTLSGGQDAFFAKFCTTPKPGITPPGTPTLCLNDSWTLTATPGFFSYFWNGGQNTSSIVVGNLTQGIHYYNVYVYDTYGCSGYSDSVSVQVNNCITGIEEERSEMRFSSYPNPAADEVHILVSGNARQGTYPLTLISALGQMIKQEEMKGEEHEMSLLGLAPGIYFIELHTKEGILREKIIKK